MIYEGKGANAALGYRAVDGVNAEQGTSKYLTAVLGRDQRIAEQLHEFLKTADPKVAEAIRTSPIEIRYELVNARADGRVDVTPFVTDAHGGKLTFTYEGD